MVSVKFWALLHIESSFHEWEKLHWPLDTVKLAADAAGAHTPAVTAVAVRQATVFFAMLIMRSFLGRGVCERQLFGS